MSNTGKVKYQTQQIWSDIILVRYPAWCDHPPCYFRNSHTIKCMDSLVESLSRSSSRHLGYVANVSACTTNGLAPESHGINARMWPGMSLHERMGNDEIQLTAFPHQQCHLQLRWLDSSCEIRMEGHSQIPLRTWSRTPPHR